MLLLILVLSVVAATLTFRNRLFGTSSRSAPAWTFRAGRVSCCAPKRRSTRASGTRTPIWKPCAKCWKTASTRPACRNRRSLPRRPDQIIIELPGLKNEAEIRDQLQSTASLQFYLLPQLGDKEGRTPGRWYQIRVKDPKTGVEEETLLDAQTRQPVPTQVLQEEVFSQDPIAGGGDLASSSAQPSQGTGSAAKP